MPAGKGWGSRDRAPAVSQTEVIAQLTDAGKQQKDRILFADGRMIVEQWHTTSVRNNEPPGLKAKELDGLSSRAGCIVSPIWETRPSGSDPRYP